MPVARELAKEIWNAGVDRVRAKRLIEDNVLCDVDQLTLCSTRLDLASVDKICVVGGGKAAGSLAIALTQAMKPIAKEKGLHGLVNVPANCVQANEFIRLHAGRPASVNEPRPEGVAGTREMLSMVRSLESNDICICLITGGGSALLPAPIASITLDDKLNVTRLLSRRGATIQELNCVRTALSDIKGGGLARSCNANRLVTLIVSDIIGDPLDLIASGPTIEVELGRDPPKDVLSNYVRREELRAAVWDAVSNWSPTKKKPAQPKQFHSHLLANNSTAVAAAVQTATSLGLQTTVIESESPKTTAEEVANQLVARLKACSATRHCIIWGGEPVVHLNEGATGRGGRNQQLVLTFLHQWNQIVATNRDRICVLSGGTDGEDGPTDAAGAFVDAEIVQSAYNLKLDAGEFLARHDAYTFFQSAGGLLKTGPTHTNVCDLRIAVVV